MRTHLKGVSRDIEKVFEEADIQTVWDYLYDTFHFNIRDWKVAFAEECKSLPRNVSIQEYFIHYGYTHFNPIINAIRKLPEWHGSWEGLLRHLMKGKIQERTNLGNRWRKKSN